MLGRLHKSLPLSVRAFSPEFLYILLFFVFISINLLVNVIVLGQYPPVHFDIQESDVIYFSYYALAWVIVFYFAVRTRFFPDRETENVSPIKRRKISLNFITYSLIIFSFSFLAIYITTTGGIVSFITEHREVVYSEQWSKSAEQMRTNYIRTISGFAFIGAALGAGILQARYIKDKGRSSFLAFMPVLPGFLVKVALFSRGAVLMLILYWIGKNVTLKKRSRSFILTISIIFIMIIFSVIYGYSQRGGEVSLESILSLLGFIANIGMNGVSTILNSFHVTKVSSEEGGIISLLLQASPIPSFIYSDADYNNNLSYFLFGSKSGSSMPMPFIGEVYYNIGWFGLTVPFLYGKLCKLVSKRLNLYGENFDANYILLYGALVLSMIYMWHSGVRSSTRMLLWVTLILVLVKIFKFLTNNKKF